MSVLLECKQLVKRYGYTQALTGINLNFEKGKIIGLLGPNGSGKTTLIKLTAGLLRPTSGEITINGEKVGQKTKSVVSYLPDRNYIPKHMKIEKILYLFSDFYKDFDKNRAMEMLKNLGLDPSNRIKSLSKGMLEKLQLILVMSRQAELYLLDEPIAGVDPAARDYILNTIITNYNPSASIIISTHLISDIENILDDIIMIKNGSIVMQGDADSIRDEHQKSIDEIFREVFRC